MGSFSGLLGILEYYSDNGGEIFFWSLFDLYDDFIFFDEFDFYFIIFFYDDLDEEEEEEEEDKDVVGGGDLVDENDFLVFIEKFVLGLGIG